MKKFKIYALYLILGIFIFGSLGCSGKNFEMLTKEGSSPPAVSTVASLNNSTVEVLFEGTLDPASAQSAANYIIDGLNVFSASLSGQTVTLTCSSQDAITYSITISGVTNASGKVMSEYTGSFTGKSPAETDTAAPEIQSITVESNKYILITFTEAVEEESAETTGNYSIPGLTVNAAERLITNNAQVRLTTSSQSAISYTLTITADSINDFAGNGITSTPNLGLGNTGTFSGDARPDVSSVSSPPPDKNHVVVTFSEDVDLATATVSSNYSIKNSADAILTVYSASRTASSQVTLTTDAQASSTTYTLQVVGVKDLTGNIIVNNSNNFTTIATPPSDTTDPIVVSAVAINVTTVRITFSETVSVATANSSVNYSVTGGYTVSAAARRSSNNSQVDVTLTSATNGESLTIIATNIQDLAGRNIGSPNSATFTADSRPTLLSAVSTGSTSLRLTFSKEITEVSSECTTTSTPSCSDRYSINNGITVYSATRIDATHVDLVSSAQQNSSYTATVTPDSGTNSVMDANGNYITTGSNTANFTGTYTDITPPALQSVTALSTSSTVETTLQLRFSETVTTASSENTANYSVTPGSITITSAQRQSDPTVVIVTVTNSGTALANGPYTLATSNIKDNALNSLYPNPTNSPFTVNAAWTISNVYEYDCDNNGNIDEVVIEFNRELHDGSISDSDAARFELSGTSFIKIDSNSGGTGSPTIGCSDATDPGEPDDEYITLFTNDMTVTGTEAKELAYVQSTDRVEDLFGNDMDDIILPAINVTDKAKPVIIKASADTGDSSLKILFSEAVQSANNGSPCSGILNVAGDVNYNNTNGTGSGVVNIADGTDMNGCDFSITVSTASSRTFITSDLFNDSVNAISNGIFDVAGNTAPSSKNVTVKGIIKPYVVNVVSISQTKIRITYSEAVTNAADGSHGGDNGKAADVYTNYTYTVLAGGCTGTLTGASKVSDTIYELTTGQVQVDTCTYKLEVTGNVRDKNEDAPMTNPKFGTFVGNEDLKVISAEAQSLYTVLITFSKDVRDGSDIGGSERTSYYTLPASLGSVTGADRQAQKNQVLITHSTAQGIGVYSVVINTALWSDANDDGLADAEDSNLQGNPKDRTTFVGFGGNIEKLEDGALFTDPFADGTSFAFAFEYGGKIYLGPNDKNDGVFRFDPDGSNSTLVTFNICTTYSLPNCTSRKSSFGANITRRARQVSQTGYDIVYQLPPDTNLTNYSNGNNVTVTGCTLTYAADYNRSSTATTIDPDAFTVTITAGSAATTSSSEETCEVKIRNDAGPFSYDGVNAFANIKISSDNYLVFGGNIDTTKLDYVFFTKDLDNVLDIDYCSVAASNVGNTQSLQQLYGYGGTMAYTAFASDNTNKMPIISIYDLSLKGVACNNIGDTIDSPTSGINQTDYIGYAGDNPAKNIGIDSIVYYNSRIFVANNGGVAYTTNVPPTDPNDFEQGTGGDIIVCDDTTEGSGNCNGEWSTGGETKELPHIRRIRPGEKGVPFMVEFNGDLYIARNRATDDGFGNYTVPEIAELWKVNGTSIQGTCPVIATRDYSVGGGDSVTCSDIATNANNKSISMLIVNGDKLYVGFDNETDGAEVYRTTDGANWEMVGTSGLGPISGSDLDKNKHIITSATVFYDGKDYLYITTGCQIIQEMYDGGACDRDSGAGADFSIKVFREIDGN